MDWDRYESEATARASTAERRAIADRLRGIANLCDCDGPYSALHDFADELDPPKEA